MVVFHRTAPGPSAPAWYCMRQVCALLALGACVITGVRSLPSMICNTAGMEDSLVWHEHTRIQTVLPRARSGGWHAVPIVPQIAPHTPPPRAHAHAYTHTTYTDVRSTHMLRCAAMYTQIENVWVRAHVHMHCLLPTLRLHEHTHATTCRHHPIGIATAQQAPRHWAPTLPPGRGAPAKVSIVVKMS